MKARDRYNPRPVAPAELYLRDVRREGDEEMPAMQRVYLYPETRVRFPNLAPQTVVSIEKWSADRIPQGPLRSALDLLR